MNIFSTTVGETTLAARAAYVGFRTATVNRPHEETIYRITVASSNGQTGQFSFYTPRAGRVELSEKEIREALRAIANDATITVNSRDGQEMADELCLPYETAKDRARADSLYSACLKSAERLARLGLDTEDAQLLLYNQLREEK